jgi:hypothetical protein
VSLVRRVQRLDKSESSWIDRVAEDMAATDVNVKRDVARRRNFTKEGHGYEPDYNASMKFLWVQIWASQARGEDESMKNYVTACLTLYSLAQAKVKDTIPFLPTNYVKAKLFLNKMADQKRQPLQHGLVNTVAVCVVDNARRALAPRATCDLPEGITYALNECRAEHEGGEGLRLVSQEV